MTDFQNKERLLRGPGSTNWTPGRGYPGSCSFWNFFLSMKSPFRGFLSNPKKSHRFLWNGRNWYRSTPDMDKGSLVFRYRLKPAECSLIMMCLCKTQGWGGGGVLAVHMMGSRVQRSFILWTQQNTRARNFTPTSLASKFSIPPPPTHTHTQNKITRMLEWTIVGSTDCNKNFTWRSVLRVK